MSGKGKRAGTADTRYSTVGFITVLAYVPSLIVAPRFVELYGVLFGDERFGPAIALYHIASLALVALLVVAALRLRLGTSPHGKRRTILRSLIIIAMVNLPLFTLLAVWLSGFLEAVGTRGNWID